MGNGVAPFGACVREVVTSSSAEAKLKDALATGSLRRSEQQELFVGPFEPQLVDDIRAAWRDLIPQR